MSEKQKRSRKEAAEKIFSLDIETLRKLSEYMTSSLKDGTMDFVASERSYSLRIKSDPKIEGMESGKASDIISDIIGILYYLLTRAERPEEIHPRVFDLPDSLAEKVSQFWQMSIDAGLMDEIDLRMNNFAPKIILSSIRGRNITIQSDKLIGNRHRNAVELAFETSDGAEIKRHYYAMSQMEFGALINMLVELNKDLSGGN